MAEHRHPIVIAHRGASGYRPEHSRAAYELAVQQGAVAIEPDIVPTKDGVLVVRHENEIGATTDVADRPEFAHLRTTKTVLGHEFTGWFTEDFTWDELSSLRVRERVPGLRPGSAAFDDQQPMLRLSDVFELLVDTGVTVVAELKHPTYFASIGLPLDELFAAEVARAAWPAERLVVESFETTVLRQLRERGVGGANVFLVDSQGSPLDELVARGPEAAKSFADYVTDAGLGELAASGFVDGVSFERTMLVEAGGGRVRVNDRVARAKDAGLLTYLWTLRPENEFLLPQHRRGTDPAAFSAWEEEFGLFLSSGIDGVFADHPDLVLRLRDAG